MYARASHWSHLRTKYFLFYFSRKSKVVKQVKWKRGSSNQKKSKARLASTWYYDFLSVYFTWYGILTCGLLRFLISDFYLWSFCDTYFVVIFPNRVKMLRFLSKRFNRSTRGGKNRASEGKTLTKAGKNILPCKIILLDGSDLSVDVHVSIFITFLCRKLLELSCYLLLTVNVSYMIQYAVLHPKVEI